MASGTGTTAANDILKKLFNNTALSWDANTNLFVALHTASPGAAGNQQTNEASYTGYTRQSIARSSAGWTVSGNSVQNAASITFPTNTGSTQIITAVSIGTVSSGTGEILFYGDLNAPVTLNNGDQLQFSSPTLTVQES